MQQSIGDGKLTYFSKWLLALTLLWIVIFIGAFETPAQLFISNWPLILVGFFGAIIGNMTAIGGGIVFIPVLMFVYKTDPVSALKLAFVSQAIGMSSGATGWLQRKQVPLNMLKWTIPPLLLGTAFATFVINVIYKYTCMYYIYYIIYIIHVYIIYFLMSRYRYHSY